MVGVVGVPSADPRKTMDTPTILCRGVADLGVGVVEVPSAGPRKMDTLTIRCGAVGDGAVGVPSTDPRKTMDTPTSRCRGVADVGEGVVGGPSADPR